MIIDKEIWLLLPNEIKEVIKDKEISNKIETEIWVIEGKTKGKKE